MTIRIPDVSNYQPNVDWAQVIASGRAGGICKATQGTTFRDPTFARNWSTLGSLNALRGAYHFGQTGGSGADQARFFLSVVGPTKPTDLLILDLEVGGGDLSAFAWDFLVTVRALTGRTPWLYSYAPFIRAHLTDPRLAAFPLWLAAYQTNPPACPPPWKTYALWQHTDKASIPGIAGNVDESVGDLPAPIQAVPAPPPAPIVDIQEDTVKQTSVRIGPLDGNGEGWADFDPALGRDPNICGLVLLGPSPPDDGYWPGQAHVLLAAQPRAGKVRISVRNGTPGDTVTAFVAVS